MKKEIRVMIFDMDGVILDSEPLHELAREQMFEKYGIAGAQDLPNPVGRSTCGFWQLVLAKYGMEGDPRVFEREHYELVSKLVVEKKLPPSQGLLPLLDWARERGIKRAIASSSTRKLVYTVLEHLNLAAYFDGVACGDEVENKKPAPDVYLRALSLVGADAAHAAAVEDSSSGIEAAHAAGLRCFGYHNLTSGIQDLSKADWQVEHLKEIQELLLQEHI